jgi:hypothetical protein
VEDELGHEPGAKERSEAWLRRVMQAVSERCVWLPEPAELQEQIERCYQRYLEHLPR